MAYIDDNGKVHFEAARFIDSEGREQDFDNLKISKSQNSNASGELCAHTSLAALIASAEECAASQVKAFGSWSA